MAKRLTKKQRQATRIGAVIAVLLLVGALAVISTVDSSLSSIVDEEGVLIPMAMPVLGMDVAADLTDARIIQIGGIGCGPALSTSMVGAFDVNSTVGNGTAFNTTGPVVFCEPVFATRFFYLQEISGFTAQDVLDSKAKAVSFGFTQSNVSKSNQTIGAKFGLISPAISAFAQPFCSATCPNIDYVTGTEGLYVFDSDFVALMASFPGYFLIVSFSDTSPSPNLPDFTDEVTIDMTLYGEELPVGVVPAGGGNLVTDLSDIMSVETILGGMYYLIAGLMTLSAAMIWPTMTTHDIGKKMSRRKS